MKLLAINGSPRGDKGNTAVVLDAFLQSVRDAGAGVEVLYTSKLDIKHCNGDVACWTKNPGICGKKDDMKMVLDRIKAADVLVLGAPVYVDSFPGPMKNLLDRMIPAMQPFFELRDGRTRHPPREGFGGKKVVLVSVCGLYELENFDVMVKHFKAFADNYDAEVAGALLRPHGGGLTFLKEKEIMLPVLKACADAGKELVQNGRVSSASEEAVSAPLFTRERHMDIVNNSFQRALDKLQDR